MPAGTDIIARGLGAKALASAKDAHLRIDAFPNGLNYKGAVNYRADLDNLAASVGDVYTVLYKGTSGTENWGAEFAYGTYQGSNQWIQFGVDYSAEIEALKNSKVDKEITGTNGKALIFNEADGGGAKFENNDGVESFVGVNDGGASGIAAQIYADKLVGGKWYGAKIDVTNGGAYYTVGDQTSAERDVEANEIATKGNIATAIQGIKTYLPFPNGEIRGTLEELIEAVLNFPSKAQGMAYLGSIAGSCTPFGYGNAECTVTFMTDDIAVLSVSSSNINPYRWELNTNTGVWRKWSDVSVSASGSSVNEVNYIKINDTEYKLPTGITNYNQLSNKPKINNVELSGNKTLANLGLNDELKSINGESLVGSGNIVIKTYRPLKNEWKQTSTVGGLTIAEFCGHINADSTVAVGDAYCGTISSTNFFQGMHFADPLDPLGSAEVSVQILNPWGTGFVQLLTVTSSNHAPYLWQYTWVDGSSTEGWRSWSDVRALETSGSNLSKIGIDGNEYNISTATGDATIGRNFTTDITVGHLASGTQITSDMLIKDLIYQILYEAPAVTLYSQYKESATIPSTIDSSWTQAEIPSDAKTNGLTFTVAGSVARGYLGLAYDKSLGSIQHIYQNNLPFDLLPDFKVKEVTYNNKAYYMYYTDEEGILESGDTFKLIW